MLGIGRWSRMAALGLGALLVACGAAPRSARPPDPVVDGWKRLDRSVVPRRYVLDLSVDPTQPRYRGHVSIEVELSRGLDAIALHAEELELSRAQVIQGGQTVSARPVPGLRGGMALVPERPLPPGPARLEIDFEAAFGSASHGLYRVEDRGRHYAFTQFQPLSARRAFPCFDQPEFKTPYRVTLRVPKHMTAVSSGPMVTRATRDPERIFGFAETQPIPSYLLALAVGEFDVVPVPRDDRPGPVLRVLTPAGRAHLAGFAVERTPPILDWLVEWFGRPLPFAKLDQVAVPEFAFGAMENVGLVTYRESRLLVDPAHDTVRDRMWTEITIAHELSHMWFGNWVTLPWWDDLWLNESFASWMQTKVVDAVNPELEAGLEATAHVQYVMYLDSKRDARAVRHPVETGGDVYNAFDGITYGKGAAVLRMVESWIGEEVFREGVRSYLEDHAYGSGGTAELLAALDRASDEPVSRVVGGFVDRPGTPLVSARLECDPGGLWPAKLALEQRRYTPVDRTAEAGPPWTFPLCVRWSAASGNGHGARGASGDDQACFLVESAAQAVRLPTPHCPAWVHPNAGARGYYRWLLPEDDLLALVREHRSALDVRERLALPGDLRALLEAGEIPVETYLEALLALSTDGHRRMAEAIAPGLESLGRLVEDEAAEDFARLVQRMLSPYLARIGLGPKPGESDHAASLRARVLPVLADEGRDPAIRSRARRAAEAFLAGDPRGWTADELRELVPMASWQSDAAHWERLRARLDAADSPALRQTVVRALGSFEDPILLARSLDLVLDGTLRAHEWAPLSGSVRPDARAGAWDWMRRNHEALVARLGPMGAAHLPQLGSGFCTRSDRDGLASFFRGRGGVPGLERNLALALEDVERCAAAREAMGKPLREWLRAQPRGSFPRGP